jgi:hypothetical protein
MRHERELVQFHAKKHAKNMHNKNTLGMNEHETGMNEA